MLSVSNNEPAVSIDGDQFVILAWFFQPQYVTATATLWVKKPPVFIFTGPIAPPKSHDEWEVWRATNVAKVKSYSVLQTALVNPEFARTKLANSQNPVEWLHYNLVVEYRDSSQIIDVKLRGRKEDAEDLAVIVDCICEAFLEVYGSINASDKKEPEAARVHWIDHAYTVFE